MATLQLQKLIDHNTCIRLLCFLPDGQKRNAIPSNRFDIRGHELHEVRNEFVAVSHHWHRSETKPTKNGQGFLMGEDLVQLILQLKDVEPFVKAHFEKKACVFRGFWVDAVCLNQEDDPSNVEKKPQLALMPQIFSSAGLCLAVIGRSVSRNPSDSHLRYAIKYLRTGLAHHLATDLSDSMSIIGSRAFPAYGLLELFGLSYFRRIWILQEVFLSDKIYLLHDSTTVPWKELHTLFEELEKLSRNASISLRWRGWVIKMTQTPAYSVIRQRHLY
ncbi:heterokaryon incompatibility protein-domain-containing protein [Astrocystis sublimbata]|nr:heterokaryon incompatibility protein-domain-containing protein [Astrocystis sublimbata]